MQRTKPNYIIDIEEKLNNLGRKDIYILAKDKEAEECYCKVLRGRTKFKCGNIKLISDMKEKKQFINVSKSMLILCGEWWKSTTMTMIDIQILINEAADSYIIGTKNL